MNEYENILIEMNDLAEKINRDWIEVLDRCLEQKERDRVKGTLAQG